MSVSVDDDCEEALYLENLFNIKVSNNSSVPSKPVSVPTTKRPGVTCISAAAYDQLKRRLYYGLENGEVNFWTLNLNGAGTSRYVGAHKGPVTQICIPKKQDGELGKAGLLLTGSVDSQIKIWDYKGKVVMDPTVSVQTLYGHSGTITGLAVYSSYILSCSTDGTIKVWRAVEGRGQLMYPWYDLEVRYVKI